MAEPWTDFHTVDEEPYGNSAHARGRIERRIAALRAVVVLGKGFDSK